MTVQGTGGSHGRMRTPLLRLPRWGEAGWWASYWEDVRPRLVIVRIDAGRARIRWCVPLWALEESLRFVLLALPWIVYARRWAPARWRSELAKPERRRRIVIEPSDRLPWHALGALLEGHGEGMLRLPSGARFVLVEAGARGRAVRVEVTQL